MPGPWGRGGWAWHVQGTRVARGERSDGKWEETVSERWADAAPIGFVGYEKKFGFYSKM